MHCISCACTRVRSVQLMYVCRAQAAAWALSLKRDCIAYCVAVSLMLHVTWCSDSSPRRLAVACGTEPSIQTVMPSWVFATTCKPERPETCQKIRKTQFTRSMASSRHDRRLVSMGQQDDDARKPRREVCGGVQSQVSGSTEGCEGFKGTVTSEIPC